MNTSKILQKLWNYCNVLRDDGMSYGDYVEQLTYLLFLKMADEPACTYRCSGKRTSATAPALLNLPPSMAVASAPHGDNQKSPVPSMYSWPPSPQPSPASGRGSFVCDGDELFDHYRHTLEALGLLARGAQASNQRACSG